MVMIVAGLVSVLFHRMRQPVVLGYIMVGVIIGPHTPPFPLISDEATIHTLAELGIVFLMFSLGLDFNLRKLTRVGWTAFIAGTLGILLMGWAGYATGSLLGWSAMDSLFLGAILSISSTTITVKALAELGWTGEEAAELMFGILIVEDILAIVIIALLSSIAMTGSLNAGEILITGAKLGIFLAVALVLGLLLVPKLLSYIGAFKSNEIMLIAVLGLCFGVSLLSINLWRTSALGAFLIGAVMAEARETGLIETLTRPISHMFSAVFFVAVGLLIDPALLWQYALPIAVITVTVVLGKVVTRTFGTLVAGHDLHTSCRVGLGLAHIGEFSFIIAALGLTLHVTSDFLYPIAVSVAVITTFLAPYFIRNSDSLAEWIGKRAPRPFLNYLEVYRLWVERIRQAGMASAVRRQIARAIRILSLNIMLIAGAFLTAAFAARTARSWLPLFDQHPGVLKTAFWLGAAILTLPLFIATFRKLQALTTLLAELGTQAAPPGQRAKAIRLVIANTMLLAGLVGLSLFTLLLSSTILPPLNVLAVLLLGIAILAWVFGQRLSDMYTNAQISLQETFARPSAPRHVEPLPPPPPSLETFHLDTVTLTRRSPTARKLIREVDLRRKTGVTITCIERGKERIFNPGPDEVLHAGDELLIIGNLKQLTHARTLLLKGMRP